MNGRSGRNSTHDPKRRQAVELRQGEIGDDDIGREFDAFAPQFSFCFYPPDDEFHAAALELAQRHLGVRRHVLDHQHFEHDSHERVLTVSSPPPRRADG